MDLKNWFFILIPGLLLHTHVEENIILGYI